VHHEIGTQLEWMLIYGSRECVVHDYQRSLAMRRSRKAGDIDHFDSRIGRRLKVQEPASLRDCGFNRRVIGCIAEDHFNFKSRQKFQE
jgi:hypothetical protein